MYIYICAYTYIYTYVNPKIIMWFAFFTRIRRCHLDSPGCSARSSRTSLSDFWKMPWSALRRRRPNRSIPMGHPMGHPP